MARLRHSLEWPDETDAVLVVGAGALGSEVVGLLAHCGVRLIHLVDPDVVSESTVARSLAARPDDIGRLKVECLSELHAAERSSATIRAWPGYFEALPEGLLRSCAMVLGCVDSVRSRLKISQACTFAGVPYLDGGVSDWGAGVALYTPSSDGPCFRCTVSAAEIDDEAARFSCGGDEMATLSLQSTAAVAGGLMVQEALKLRSASPDAMRGGEHISYAAREVALMRSWSAVNPDCLGPHCQIEVVEVTTTATKAEDVVDSIAAQLAIDADLAVSWPTPWAYCCDCDLISRTLEARYDPQRGATVLCQVDCQHGRIAPLLDVGGLPAWSSTVRPALHHRRLSVFERAAARQHHVLMVLPDGPYHQ